MALVADEDGAADAQGGPPPSSRELLDVLAATADAQRAIVRLSVEAHDREHEQELAHLVRSEAVEAKARQLRAVSDVLRSLTANKDKLLVQLQQPKVEPCIPVEIAQQRAVGETVQLYDTCFSKLLPACDFVHQLQHLTLCKWNLVHDHQQDFYQLVKRAAAEASNLLTAHDAVAWALAFDEPASSWQSSLQEHAAATSAVLQHHEALSTIRATIASSMHRGGVDDKLAL
eukprot:SM000051S17571  [mRNA]  locus=s51:437447:439033:- [translate_table: standard]